MRGLPEHQVENQKRTRAYSRRPGVTRYLPPVVFFSPWLALRELLGLALLAVLLACSFAPSFRPFAGVGALAGFVLTDFMKLPRSSGHSNDRGWDYHGQMPGATRSHLLLEL